MISKFVKSILCIFLFSVPSNNASADDCIRQGKSLSNVDDIQAFVSSEITKNPLVYQNGESKLFIIKKNSSVIGFLYGTYHYTNGRTTLLQKVVYDAFISSDGLVVESNLPETPVAKLKDFRQKYNDLAQTKSWTAPYKRLSDDDQSRLNAYLSSSGYSSSAIGKLSLLGLERALSLPTCVDSSQLWNFGGHPSDVLLSNWALAQGKPVIEIEQLDHTLSVFGDPDSPENLEILKLQIRRYKNLTRLMNYELDQYYIGNVSNIVAAEWFFLATDSERKVINARNEQLISARNVEFTQKIIGSLDPRRKMFVAVGAAHLVGSDGLVARLRAENLVVEPVAIDTTRPQTN